MQLRIPCEMLLKALQQIAGVVEKRQTMPVLSNVLLAVSPHLATLTATDLELELQAQLTLDDVEEAFEVTLPARKLMDICRALPKTEIIHFLFNNQSVSVKTQTTKFTLMTLPAADFPSLDEGPCELEWSLPEQELLFLLHRTHFAMAQQDVRAYLNGIMLEVSASKLRLVATDGHRLALADYPLSLSLSEERQAIVPRKAVLELTRVLAEDEKPVQISIGQQHIRFKFANLTLTSKLIEGRFPDFENVLPKQCHQTMQVDKTRLKDALARIAVLCNEKYKGVRFMLQQDNLHLSASNPEHEQAEEELAMSYVGETLEIGFNARYLQDILNVINGDVCFRFKDSNSSVLLEEADASGLIVYVLMPMRL